MIESFKNDSRPQEQLRVVQRQQSLKRMYGLMTLFIAGFVIVGMKLFVIQIRDSEELKELGKNQYESREIVPPVRGLILDRNLSILASNVTEYSLVADPSVLERPDTVARYFARVLPGTERQYYEKLRDTTRRFVVLEKRLPASIAEAFKHWKCYGVRLRPTPRRRYNFNALAGPVIGYTNVDNRGQSGIELEMNDELAGQEGFIVYQRNARGLRRPDVDNPRRDPVNGRHVVLTIHQAYQSIAEEELSKGVERHAAESGRCIIIQPRTGEILAMANYPSLDLNNLSSYSPDAARNRSVTDLYEPGSTFKIVAMSAALNEQLYKPLDKIWAENGRWQYSASQKPITDDHPYGWITMQGAFEHSSNIVSAKLADKLGAERFYKYARNFGFGIQTGVELPGELRGDLRKPMQWDGTTLRYLAFGYGLAVTSLQIASAYAAIANDGVLMRPYIRKWMLDQDRNIVDENVPQIVRRVVSSETAATMRHFMQGVVDSGTARLARIEGMSIGGKTGTSQRLVNGSYSNRSHVASFVGFFPVDDPKILILVILDAPKNGYYGGAVAAPIFREIALRIINSSIEFAKKPEDLITEARRNGPLRLPNLRGMRADVAREQLKVRGLRLECDGGATDGVIASQTPAAGSEAARGSVVRARLVAGDVRQTRRVTVPDLQGLTVRQAMTLLGGVRLTGSPIGTGIVRMQDPMPGAQLPPGGRVSLICEPRTVHTANLY